MQKGDKARREKQWEYKAEEQKDRWKINCKVPLRGSDFKRRTFYRGREGAWKEQELSSPDLYKRMPRLHRG